MRFKKQIIIICLFTFLFVPFNSSISANSSPRIAIADDVLFIALGTLILGSGAIAVSMPMLQDMGSRVYDDFISKGGEKESILATSINATGVALKVTKTLYDSVNYISSVLPKSITTVNSHLVTDTTYSLTIGSHNVPTNSYPAKTIVSDFVAPSQCYVNIYDKNGSIIKSELVGGNHRYQLFNYVDYRGSVVMAFSRVDVATGNELATLFQKVVSKGNVFGYDITGDVVFETGSILQEIPYDDEKVHSNYNPTYLPGIFQGVSGGLGNGSLDIPLDDSKPNYGLTFPLDWDNVKDNVKDTPKDDVVDPPIDGSIDKPNTGDSIFDKFGEWLSSLLGTLFAPLVKLLTSILEFLKGLIIPTEWNALDFSPLYFSFADKFPFSIPFDLINIFKQFSSAKKEPIFYVDMSGFSSNRYSRDEVGFELDLTKFESLFEIIRFFTLVGFVVTIALKTRDIIKG